MKNNIILACALIASTSSTFLFARNNEINKFHAIATLNDSLPTKDTSTLDATNDRQHFEKVDMEAQFPGGEEGWRNFVMVHLNPEVPIKKQAPAGKYMVIVQFIVDKDGSVTNITPLTKYGYGMEPEVVRVLQQSPKWKPAQQNGRFVNAYRKQPITFVVEEEKRKKRIFN